MKVYEDHCFHFNQKKRGTEEHLTEERVDLSRPLFFQVRCQESREMMMKKMEGCFPTSRSTTVAVSETEIRLNIDDSLSTLPLEVKTITAENLTEGFGFPNETILTHSQLPAPTGLFNPYIKNQFISCAFDAFNSHRGFVFSPSQIFLLIVQQISLHVNAHAEELRNQFVKYEGKKDLSVDVSASPSPEEWADDRHI